MFSFADIVDLPLLWGGILALAILMYVMLDGFDLGIGILFPFAPSNQCRDRMMNSVAPFWDGNETWLVLGGGGLLAAFPLAYSIILPALYVPVILMLLCLIFRGVAFEFRFKANRSRRVWDIAFHYGSLGAAFLQGMILGGFVQGIEVEGRSFAGGAFDWLTGFSVMCGLAVVCGHVLLGATWLVMKTEDKTQDWARVTAQYIWVFVAFFMALVAIWVPWLGDNIKERWFGGNNLYYLSPLPILTGAAFIGLIVALKAGREVLPFLLSLAIFLFGFIGLGISLWPWAVPFAVTLDQAAASPESLSLLLVGVGIMLPIILAYTAYSYFVFKGKSSHEPLY